MLSKVSLQYLHRTIILLATLAMFRVATAQTPATGNFSWYRNITINPNSVYGSGSHVDMPYFLYLKDPGFEGTATGGHITSNNGYDVLLTNNDGTQALDFEIEGYDPAKGDYYIWVRIPELSCTDPTILRIYYGDSTATANPSSGSTFTPNYMSVWHMANTSCNDATGNYNASRTRVSGSSNSQLGMGIDLDGANDYVNWGVMDVPGTEATFSSWFKPASLSGEPKILAKCTGANLADNFWGFDLEQTAANTAALRFRLKTTNGIVEISGGTITTGNYYAATATYDGTMVRLYLNGIEVDNAALSGNIAAGSSTEAWTGGNPTGRTNNPFGGIIDETRILTSVLSPNWILTEYTNQQNPRNNYTLSAEMPHVIDPLTITGTTNDATCNGALTGSIDISVSGGFTPYSYAWSNNSTTEDLQAIATGNYTVTVTDASGSTASQSFQVNQPAGIQLNTTITPPVCKADSNGSIDLTVAGGISPYTFQWSNGDTSQSITGLQAGIYTITVIDAAGCNAIHTDTIEDPQGIDVLLTTTDETQTGNDGTISLAAQGGAVPYKYNWSTGSTTQNLQNLSGGSYSVTVTDANGCSTIASAIVNGYVAPPQPVNTITWTGAADNNWSNAENWLPTRVPDCENDVVISASAIHTASIDTSSIAEVGDLTIETNASLDMHTGSRLSICGNLNIDGDLNAFGGIVSFKGNSIQVLTASATPQVFQLEMNNSGPGLQLQTNLIVLNKLTLNSGLINTGTDTLILQNTNGNGQTITAYSASSYVVGHLRRNIASNDQLYVFPVGNTNLNGFHWAKLYNNKLQGTHAVTVSFTPLVRNNDTDINFEDNDITYVRIAPEGMWVITPDAQPTQGNYDLVLSTQYIEDLIDNDFGILERPYGTDASQWTDGGAIKSSFGGSGRMVTDGYCKLRKLSSFSEFGIGLGNSSGKIIKLHSFDAYFDQSGGRVVLDWIKNVEIDVDHYIIQRSIDGSMFEDIKQVEGLGTTTELAKYESFDNKPPLGIVYYRLKQVSKNGQYSYTDMVSVSVLSYVSQESVIFPNPTRDYVNITVETSGKHITFMLIDLSGHLVQMYEVETDGGTTTVRMKLRDGLPSGQYLVKIGTDEGESLQKLMIQN